MYLRPATLPDAAKLAPLAEYTFRHTYEAYNTPQDMELECARNFSLQALQAQLQNEAYSFWLVFASGHLIAYAKYTWQASFTHIPGHQQALEVSRIYVHPAHKGKGAGQLLLRHSHLLARYAGKTAIMLGVWQQNQAAIHFYQKMGMQQVGITTYVLGTDEQTDWVMMKQI